MQQFAVSIAQRCEGLVLKPCGVPYFSLDLYPNGYAYSYIKLKKDYIAGLGDEADFAVVGASYNAQQAVKSGLNGIKWTSFHLGCLTNKGDVQRFGARPCFKVVGTIQQDACIPKPVLQAANDLGRFCAVPFCKEQQPAQFDLKYGNGVNITTVFTSPFVFEVLGSGFGKPSNTNFFMLRHPRVKKLHQDRAWKDCVSMRELQEQAAAARAGPVDAEPEETRAWIEKLERKGRRKSDREKTATPRMRTTATPTTITSTASDVPSTRKSARLTGQLKQQTAAVPVSAETFALDGTNLDECVSSGSKRRRDASDATPCPATKKSCVENFSTEGFDGPAAPHGELRPRSRTAPLLDITNTAPRPNDSRMQDIIASKDRPGGRSLLDKLSTQFRTAEKGDLHQSPSSNRHGSEPGSIQCKRRTCLFANAVVHFSICIATTPYIVEDLLRSHDAIHADDLSHWNRDAFAHPLLTEIVSESQAYGGLRKIVLVEAKRTRVVKKFVGQIVGLNSGKLRERVEVYDWRVLEHCTGHDIGAADAKKYFLGATMFDESRERTMFISNVRWLET